MGLLYPPYLQWEVTSDCNHRCIHCYNYWRADDIPVEECCNFETIAKKIIERKPLYIAITGGEPLLVFSRIKTVIKMFVNAGIVVSISTNGTLITEEIAEFLSNNRVDLVVSFPSSNSKVCDQVTCGKNVVEKLATIWPLLKKHSINTTVNIVVNKINLPNLYETLKYISEIGFSARVGIAQRPINASKKFLPLELDIFDFENVNEICLKAKNDFGINIDYSVCIPDCAFQSDFALQEIDKGDCFAGTLAYAICTNGDIKACQCDTKVYGNVLFDSFEDVYNKMESWRDNEYVPHECLNCVKFSTCHGGCRVESFAKEKHYRGLPTFANPDRFLFYQEPSIEKVDYSFVKKFKISDNVVFLKDAQCYRVSVGIIPTFLSFEFSEWLIKHKTFSFADLRNDCEIDIQELNTTIDLLIKNYVLEIIN